MAESKYNNYLTNDEKEEIIKLHLEGLNTVQIGKKLGRSDSTIGRFLKKEGYSTHKTGKLSENDVEKIKELYLNGMTCKEIFPMFSNKITTPDTIRYVIKKEGISRNRGYRNIVNHNYFEDIDSPQKAYFLGFLLTDGSVVEREGRRQKRISFSLKFEDKYMIEMFKKEVECDNKISTYQKGRRNECGLAFSSDKMAEDLSKFGIVPNKSLIISKLPRINKEFLPDLIRGVFDGNGTVYILSKSGKLRFGFYGTYKLCDDIVKILNETIGLPLNKITTQKDANVSFITFGREQDIINFYNYIYYSEDVICLNRKKEKFVNYLNKK